ncbi:hypothetical protein H633G_04552 [Metarhizium anisopliae BRIP 53284]|nr:hypothetical protein H633G_04552 [Metarhizium anisopliae BRIP 53284]
MVGALRLGAEAASQLCDGYGRTLHEDVMASDPLYALTEVFNVTTASTRVQKLQAQCQDAISNLMNNIKLKEVRNSYEQSKRIGKLTFLAFLSIWDLQFTRKLLELTAIAIELEFQLQSTLESVFNFIAYYISDLKSESV